MIQTVSGRSVESPKVPFSSCIPVIVYDLLILFRESSVCILTIFPSYKISICARVYNITMNKYCFDSFPGIIKKVLENINSSCFGVVGNSTYNFKKFTVGDMCSLIETLVKWVKTNLGSSSKILVSLRNQPDIMPTKPKRVFHVVDFLARLNLLFGIIFEEPRGKSLLEECATWAKFIRKVMDSVNWKGNLLAHVHEKFGYMDATA
ncbi:hypothetical protein DPMN_097431 [Dreissena polymorpha]|uniref:Uncharacterized protein n=1 Tax=Dreissena polymorpha TaxID=45954 RepID=A0A9D4LAI8_DREPO|nr:hypothetical protein DPMN_097431 [Dreissena polymorpha]